jgi:hypothetical protein
MFIRKIDLLMFGNVKKRKNYSSKVIGNEIVKIYYLQECCLVIYS